MALTHGEKNGSASGTEPPTPKSASKARWFNNFLTSASGFDTPYNIMTSSSSSFGQGSEDVEAEAAIEVGEDLELDDRRLNLAFNCRRHLEDIQGSDVENQSWRMRERMKTVSVALVVCLNIGIDPPDVMKTRPCAKVECWVDPNTLNSQRAGESIGSNLQKQYERWQPRARYRLVLDPTVDEVRRLATGLRRNARDERVLFHYNGHGVPKPTANGEIWVFNRNFTQYIPLSLYELQSWMGSPSIFVYDCSNAGIIVSFFEQFAEQHEKEYLDQVNAQGVPSSELSNPISPRSCIQLAACSANQILPMHPDLPADLFTSCLTTPIKMALRWFVMQNQGKLSMKITLDMIDKIPGQFGDRRTMLGELNWIFTAITDTIAWNTLQRPLFQRLFRQDLLVASLFRNFLLAERVMRSYDCAPVSQPALPPTHQHPMWQAWDLAVDIAVSQLPDILEKGTSYKASTFFEEELTAFEVWLRYGNEHRPPPEQLPIVLQVLLSQAHRLRALDLLGRFLDLGPWAVNLALSVGIFPYVLKLLQSSARELKPLLVEIWAKILAVDSSCQSDLVRDGSQKYFVSVLQDEFMMPVHRTWATFILACLVQNCRPGQQEAEQTHLIAICIEHLEDPDPVFRQWLAILLGRMWDHYEPARWRGARDNAPERLYELLKDPVPEVRAAAVFALGTFINSCDERSEQANNLDHAIANHLLKACDDGSALVRCELIVALQYVVRAFEPNFVNVCRAAAEEEELTKQGQYSSKTLSQASNKQKSTKGLSSLHSSSSSSCLDSLVSHVPITSNRSAGSLSGSMPGSSSVSYVYSKVYSGLVFLANDPHIDVSSMASKLVEYLKLKAKDKEAARVAQLESSSMPSSPSRLSFIAPPRHQQTGVATIAEESCETLSSSADNRPSGSYSDSRLRRGRSEGRHPSGGQHSNASPQSSNTNLASTNNASGNGLRKVAALNSSRLIVPPQLDTSFISWSAKYFTKPQPKHDCFNNDSCDCDLESAAHLRREWMFTRNSELRNEGEVQNDLLRDKRGRVDGPVSPVGAPTVFRNPQQFIPNVLQFHPFSDEIVVAGQTSVTVWNTKLSRRISAFDINENRFLKSHDSISAIEFLNSHDETLLLVGSDDGGIRIYKDYASESNDDDNKSDDGDGDFHMDYFNKYRIVSAWNGLKDNSGFSNNSFHRHGSLTSFLANLNISKTSPGLRTAWSQVDMTLAVTGAESRHISLWDVNTELRRSDLYTSTDAAVTSIAFGPSHLGLLCAGFTDGSVRVFDVRSPDSRVTMFEGLAGNVLDCKLKGDQQKSSPLLIAGDSNGVMHYHELRMANSHRRSSSRLASFSVMTNPGNQVTGLTIHQTADAFAAWAQQSVSVYHFNPLLGGNTHNLVNVIKCHDEGVLGKGLGFEGCLSFHPHLLQVAIGSRDGAVSLKAFKKF